MNMMGSISYQQMMNNGGWRNITGLELEPQNQPFPVCEARRDGILRGQLEMLTLFHLVFPLSIFHWLAEEINAHTPSNEKTKYGVTGKTLMIFSSIIMWSHHHPWTVYLKKDE